MMVDQALLPGVSIVSTFRNNKRYGTRDPEEMRRLIKIMRDRDKELDHRLKKSDMNSKDLGPIKKCFGKWCYALEAAGLAVPSEETVERRNARKKKWDRKHAEARKRRKERYKQAEAEAAGAAPETTEAPAEGAKAVKGAAEAPALATEAQAEGEDQDK